ncbi:MAG TPA: hypothetical protein VFQ66_06495 [Candidatus Limnocylindria bacterium]|nr:hypothetical protein [Candidatus Limnocylindria bacterium]
MTDRRNDLLDETILRRALRLEVDERRPVFDPVAIAAMAGQRARLAIVSAFVALGLVSVGAVAAWSAVAFFLPTVVASVFDVALMVLASLAIPASAIAEIALQPVVPLSIFAALAIATLHELRERVVHANAS